MLTQREGKLGDINDFFSFLHFFFLCLPLTMQVVQSLTCDTCSWCDLTADISYMWRSYNAQ